MYHMAVYVGKHEKFLKSTIVIRKGIGIRYVSGKQHTRVHLEKDFVINSEFYEVTDIKTEEDLEIHLLSQQLLGGQ